ncbi:2-oxoglutarate dehydrogenase complex dihydrolipoyllysine-residue succinyltransferase [Paracoccaceae bacterium]|nr:2-oxoglutarate dehydrogenase complex dihydrolipoyllysine-residue succinyltransferase [Paracoccaceae bacterium]
MTTEIRVPTLGESVTEATVATWFKKPGDVVALDEMLCELETDKVTVEVPSPAAGVLSEIVAAEGTTVAVDALLANIASGAGRSEASDTAKTPVPKGPSNAAADSSDIEVAVPTLGESVTEATVASWFKAPGDNVKSDEILCELETDKVSVEVPSPNAGVLKKIIAAEGSTVDATAILAVISQAEGEGNTPAQPVPEATPSTAKASSVEDAPAAKKAMAKAGLKPSMVQGTGRDSRVMKEDVIRAVAAAARTPAATAQTPAAPRAPVMASDAAREERVKMTRLRQTIARRLKDSQNSAAMLTTYNEVDMSAVMDLRSEYKDLFLKKHGVKLGFMSFFTKACCHALQEVPEVNAEIDGTDIVYKNFVHMGIAAGTPTGLVVPVIRDVDAMSFAAIEQAISEKGQRARDGKLSMEEMQGGTFTISNGGVYGSLMSSPILNPPQSGILGMHKIQDRPIAVNGQVVIRPMMYLALSYDHRIVDGKGAVTFLVRVKDALEDPRRLLMNL